MKNKNWHELTLNPKAIESIYEVVPQLNGIVLIRIIFDRDAKMISLLFDLPRMPIKPPLKWIQQEFNTVQLKLDCIEVNSVELNGWGRDIVCSFRIARVKDEIYLESKTNVFRLKLICNFLNIASISAYHNNEE